ncbi:HNH endonuclease [Vibrio sp. JZG10]
MGISLKTQKMLWGRAASRCSFPECKKELVMDATLTDDESLVGEACHIVARSEDGPRGSSDLTSEQRDKYANLILMCNVHHKVIDDQHEHYTVEILRNFKAEHEAWVNKSLSSHDPYAQRDEEIYVSYIESFEQYIDITEWNNWTSWVFFGGQPQLSKEMKSKLDDLRGWLFSRVWPNRYPELELAFENFRRVLSDFLNTFEQHAKEHGEHMWITEKFYKINDWNPEVYDRLVGEFDYHCHLVEDLMLELNRAANYIFEKVRKFILFTYRLDVGLLYVTSGPHMDFSMRSYKTQYLPEQKTDIPYVGIEEFASKVRFERDIWFGDKET